MKKILKIFKKILFSILLLYTYNLAGISINLIIPINIITIGLVTILDLPGFMLLVLLFKLYY